MSYLNLAFTVSAAIGVPCIVFLIACIVRPEVYGLPSVTWKNTSSTFKLLILGADQFIVVGILAAVLNWS